MTLATSLRHIISPDNLKVRFNENHWSTESIDEYQFVIEFFFFVKNSNLWLSVLHCPGKEQIPEAIHFFSRAQAYGNAIRLCKEFNMEDQLLNLALLGKPNDMIDAAKFYEKSNDMQDKAGTKSPDSSGNGSFKKCFKGKKQQLDETLIK